MLETDLFRPISDFLVKAGYTVRSEVAHCDIAAVRDEELLVVELKTGFSLALLAQAAKRQKSADTVYMAVPKPKNFGRTKKWKDLVHLVRRLELGLMFVDAGKNKSRVEVVIDAVPFDREKSRQRHKKARKAALAEIRGRLSDFNTGGSTRTKLMTAYRESCIRIAVYLDINGPLSPKQLRCLGTNPRKTGDMLYQNHYGWFDHPGKGCYAISDKGREALLEFPEITRHYRSHSTFK
jgi:hypothetical protein